MTLETLTSITHDNGMPLIGILHPIFTFLKDTNLGHIVDGTALTIATLFVVGYLANRTPNRIGLK